MAKMWAGRTAGVTDPVADDFNSSIHFDSRMYREDITGSMAHAAMLGAQHILPQADADAIIDALQGILDDIDSGALTFDPACEDIHMFVEQVLTARIGDLGKKLHTARSRNDQVALDLRMYLRSETNDIIALTKDVLAALVEQAKAHKGDILPGYTHLQRAQPITFGHHLMAYAMMLLRDIDRMQDAVRRMNVSPIGCCALAGTTYDTDRFFEAKQLGFDDVAQLETVPYPQLAAAYAKVAPAIAQSGGYIGGGPKKGDYFYGNPFDAGFREHAHQIPMMIGTVYGEFATFAPAAYDKNKLTAEEILEILKKVYGDNAEKVLDAFKEAYPEKNGVDVLAIDRAMREPTVKLAKLFAKGGGKAYLYNFALEFPFQHGKPAWHCSDIPYFFGNADLVEICGIPDVSDKLESEIFGALLAFAKNGTPDHAGLPHWPEVEAEDADTMVFDRKTEVKHNYDDKVFAEINKVLKPWSFMDMMADNIQH